MFLTSVWEALITVQLIFVEKGYKKIHVLFSHVHYAVHVNCNHLTDYKAKLKYSHRNDRAVL